MNLRTDGEQQPLPAVAGLTRQSSIYGLTFDELQNTMGTLGKDYGSMNMDEFLKNIWTAEENQAMAGVLGSSSVGTSAADGTGLQHQGSLTLPRTLSQKKVDEVWRDLICAGPGPAVGGASGPNVSVPQRQPTLGEITLEEFLVRAGVVREEMTPATIASRVVTNGANCIPGTNIFYSDLASPGNGAVLSLGYGQIGRSDARVMISANAHNPAPNLAGVDMRNPQGMRGTGIVSMGDAGINAGLMPGAVGMGVSPVNHLSPDGLGKGGDISPVSPIPYVFNGGLRGRKTGAVEKVMERRQRRMIKNRESAARSRARKQAYTMELEGEVNSLKADNEKLRKKLDELMEMQKRKSLETDNQPSSSKKICCLRRTRSAPW